MTVLVRVRDSNVCKFRGFAQDLPMAWVACGDVQVGIVYLRPGLIDNEDNKSATLASLHAEVVAKKLLGPVVILGDFNAALGSLNLDSGRPRVVAEELPPALQRHTVFGAQLMEMAGELELVALTGRRDGGEESWRKQGQREARVWTRRRVGERGAGRGGDEETSDDDSESEELEWGAEAEGHQGKRRREGERISRIDHAWVQENIYDLVVRWQLGGNWMGSDHAPLLLTIKLLNTDEAEISHVPLRWDYLRKPEYRRELTCGQAAALVGEAMDKVIEGDLEGSTDKIVQAVMTAAQCAGMMRDVRAVKSAGKKLPLTAEDLGVKSEIRQYRRAGRKVPVELRRRWRQAVKAARAIRAEREGRRLAKRLRDKPRLFWSRYKSEGTGQVHGVASVQEWKQHYSQLFGVLTQLEVPAPTGEAVTRPDCVLTCHFTDEEVFDACKKLGTNKAVGYDGLPGEFVTKSYSPDAEGTQLIHVVTDMFNAVLDAGVVPISWKPKVIVPIYKCGPQEICKNYRPVAIATTLSRLFVAVVCNRLSGYWSSGEARVPLEDSQFGFRKLLSTDHAHLVLTTCVDTAVAEDCTLAIVKLDVAKAFDNVDRDILWERLTEDELPDTYINLLKELYRSASYRVRANGKYSEPFWPRKGVLQGDGLSPQSFNSLVRKALSRITARCADLGIRFTTLEVACSHADFADDIEGTVLLQHVAKFLQVVEEELASVGLTLNKGKSEMLIVNGPEEATLECVEGVRVVPKLKALGLVYGGPYWAATMQADRIAKASGKVLLHASRLQRYGSLGENDLARLMTHMDVGPTLLFGAPIWGHAGLIKKDYMQHRMQSVHTRLQRRSMGLHAKVAKWIVTLIGATRPIQIEIIGAFVRFWNKLVTEVVGMNGLVKAALAQQKHLWRNGHLCWLSRWAVALHRILHGQRMEGGTVKDRLYGLETLCPDVVDRTIATQCKLYLDLCGDHENPNCRTGKRLSPMQYWGLRDSAVCCRPWWLCTFQGSFGPSG